MYLFECGEDGCPIRQIEVYEHGPTLRYGPQSLTDEFGMLSDQPLDAEDFAPFHIDADVFEQVWRKGDEPRKRRWFRHS